MADSKLNFNEKDYYTRDESNDRYVYTNTIVVDSERLGGFLSDYYAKTNNTYTQSQIDSNFLGKTETAIDSEKLNGIPANDYALDTEVYPRSDLYIKSEIYTQDEVNTVINDAITSASSVLTTLQDLDTALNDSTNFASVCITQISQKLDSALYTPNNILIKIKTVDGSGSGLDADMVDGFHALQDSSGFSDTIPVRKTDGSIDIGNNLNFHYHELATTPSVIIKNETSDTLNITGIRSDGLLVNGNKVWTINNQGESSGLNADMVDGKHGDDLCLKVHTYTKDEVYNKTEAYSKNEIYSKDETYSKNETYNKIEINNKFIKKTSEELDADLLNGEDSTYYAKKYEIYTKLEIDDRLDDKIDGLNLTPGNILNLIKEADGPGSGLNADMVDGQHIGTMGTKNETISYNTPSGGNEGDIWIQI